MKFVHQFSRRIRCTVTVDDAPPARGTVNSLSYDWTELPDRRFVKKHLNEYRAWVLEINRILSDFWQTSILYVIQTSPTTTELWSFEPNRPPKRINDQELEAYERTE